jgi:hypothetical protein
MKNQKDYHLAHYQDVTKTCFTIYFEYQEYASEITYHFWQ